MADVRVSRIKIKRGLDKDIQKVVLAMGEPAYATDTHRFFIGDGETPGGHEVRGQLKIDASSATGPRSNYDTYGPGFMWFDQENGLVYVKRSHQVGDWSEGLSIVGPRGPVGPSNYELWLQQPGNTRLSTISIDYQSGGESFNGIIIQPLNNDKKTYVLPINVLDNGTLKVYMEDQLVPSTDYTINWGIRQLVFNNEVPVIPGTFQDFLNTLIGPEGKSAFEVWKIHFGLPDATMDDYIAWLNHSKPGTINYETDNTVSSDGTHTHKLDITPGLEPVVVTPPSGGGNNYVPSANSLVLVDTTTGPVTIDLPSPGVLKNGDTIEIFDFKRNAKNNSITVNRNGNTINGLAQNYVIDQNGYSVRFIYTNNNYSTIDNLDIIINNPEIIIPSIEWEDIQSKPSFATQSEALEGTRNDVFMSPSTTSFVLNQRVFPYIVQYVDQNAQNIMQYVDQGDQGIIQYVDQNTQKKIIFSDRYPLNEEGQEFDIWVKYTDD